MDFGGLDDILDDDIGYIPTAIKRDQKARGRPTSISRQNSSRSIGSVKDQKENSYRLNQRQTDSLFGLTREASKQASFNLSPQPAPSSGRRANLFSLHKETAQQATNLNQPVLSFEDFFKNQNNPIQNIQSLSKPPLPQPKVTIPERRLQKNSSFTQLSSPENILEDDLNNSSVASRRGRPPLSRRTQQNQNSQNEIGHNRSESLGMSNAFSPTIEPVNVVKNSSFNINPIIEKKQQIPVSSQQSFQSFSPIPSPSPAIIIPQQQVQQQIIPDHSIQQLKKLFSTQIDYQKQMFQTLIRQQRESHQQQITKVKQFHKEEIKKKLEIKDFQLQKMKEFYQLQLKLQSQRQSQVKQYSSIAKKLQGNIQIIQKLQRNIKQNNSKEKTQRQQHTQTYINKKQRELKEKQSQLKSLQTKLQQQAIQLRNQKLQLNQQINTQKNRIYQLEIQLRNKQSQLLIKYKKLQNKLNEQHQKKMRMLEKEKEQIRMQSLQLKQQRNLIEVQKLQLINSRKIWDNQKKAYLQQIHSQKTKVLEKQIQIASRTGQLEIKQQQIQMNQNDYLNKLKLVELQKKKLQIEKKTSKGQFYFNMTSQSPIGIKTNGLLGTTLLNKTSQSALKEFYSNQNYQRQGFEQQTNYKKSITQMRDQFLKSLPKF